MYEKVLMKVRNEQTENKRRLAAKSTYFQSEYKIDEQFTAFTFTVKGGVHEMRYANYALRNHTLKELERIFDYKERS